MKIIEIKSSIAELTVPHALLEAANIGLDDDLDITVYNGCIVIGSSDPLYCLPPALIDLFIGLGISPDMVRAVLEGGDEDE